MEPMYSHRQSGQVISLHMFLDTRLYQFRYLFNDLHISYSLIVADQFHHDFFGKKPAYQFVASL